jgi:hypothetical protein
MTYMRCSTPDVKDGDAVRQRRLGHKDKYDCPAALILRKCPICMMDFHLACGTPGILILLPMVGVPEQRD